MGNDGFLSPSSDRQTNTNSPTITGQRNARWDSTQPISSLAAAIPGLRRRKNATKKNDDNTNTNHDRHTTEKKYDDAAHSPKPHTLTPSFFPFVHVNEVEVDADDGGYRTPPP